MKINKNNKLSRSKYGVWGTLGSGKNCNVHFIQTILTGDDIDNVKLISEIPESQKWKVKDLFQRNVNKKTVRSSLIPYLNNDKKIKFFNPLTLIILPHDLKNNIIKNVPILNKDDFHNDFTDLDFDGLTLENHYRFGRYEDPFFSVLEWNPNNCYVVAIDGQHRLFALKEIKKDPNNVFDDWKIPAVILVVHKEEDVKTPDLLEVVRGVFIDINDKNQQLTKARKIILNDAAHVDVLCQELIEYSHSDKNPKRLPLFFFDWRGENDEAQTPVTFLIGIEELNNLLVAYFDFSEDKSKGLKLPNWLLKLGLPNEELNYDTNNQLRNYVNNDFVPAFHSFFMELKYVQIYLSEIGKKIKGTEGDYFINREKYGDSADYFDADMHEKISDYKLLVKDEIKPISIPYFLNLDIGLRAIVYCYSQKNIFEKVYNLLNNKNSDYTWMKHASFIAGLINAIISDNWFEKDKFSKDQKNLMSNLVYANSGQIINYRMEDVEKGFGALIVRICINKSGIDESLPMINEIIENLTDLLLDTFKKDLRKQVRANVAPTFNGTQKELNEEIKIRTEKEVKKKAKILNDYFK
jgi:hypothetical protein